MERSSPLAAMQPPSFLLGHHGFRSEDPTSYPSFPQLDNFGPNSFNFKDISMKRPQRDYFNLKPVRGSSPTASLAADLSQNFHIDQSPQLPTPRRSLFSTNYMGTLGGRESMVTPPLPSSSPGPSNDSMDISPLPHKIPFNVASIDVSSPTPEATPVITPRLEALIEASPETQPSMAPPERRRPTLLRPSLARAKGHSMHSVPSAESQLPPFKFGNGSSKLSTSISMSLADAFADSPPQDKTIPRNAFMNAMMGPPRPRQPFAAINGSSRGSGSPINGHVRKPSNPVCRPRKQYRRSLSMFEHPNDVMRQEKSSFASSGPMQSIMDVEPAHILQLPHFTQEDESESLPRINQETLIDVMNGKYDQLFDESVIIDCRFEYEYEGGHITNAVNYNDKDFLANKLFDVATTLRTLLIFHCEYSAHRAPIMAKFIRRKDRAMNADRYPGLTYPEMYILDGGYSSFFTNHRSRCFPQNYVEMGAKEHAHACERGLGKVKQRSKLQRAQTYAFGQHGSMQDSSPTAPGRGSMGSLSSMMDLDFPPASGSPDLGRLRATRMSSY